MIDYIYNYGSYCPQVCKKSWNAFFAEKKAPAAEVYAHSACICDCDYDGTGGM